MLTNALKIKNLRVLLAIAASAMLMPLSSFADDVAQQIEEVVVTGAVRGSQSVDVADIDLPGDEFVEELPVAYE